MTQAITQSESEAISRFPSVARDFCEFVENCSDHKLEQFLQELSIQLASLCEVAARLPWVEPATETDDIPTEPNTARVEEWRRLRNRLQAQLGDVDSYWEVFDPTQKEEPVLASLSDDIADIYLDLKDGLKFLTSGAPPNDVYLKWRVDFSVHWARHMASALKVALHISNLD